MRRASRGENGASVAVKEPLLTPAFVAVTIATAFYFLAYGAITPVLPHYVTRNLHQGNLAVGVTVGIFAVSAIVMRPLAGRLGNRVGRRWLMIGGASLAGVSILAYGFTSSLFELVVLRLVTGVGEAFFYTGSATSAADLSPPNRRGESLSLYSVAIWIGNGLGPAIGQSIYRAGGARLSFVAAAAMSTAAVLLSLRVPAMKVAADPSGLRPPLIHKAALVPGMVLALTVSGTTAFNAYVPLYADKLHLGGSQYVFLLYAAVVLSIRIFLARLPDVWGPRRTGSVASVSVALGFVIISTTGSALGLYLGTIIVATGNALIFPALLAMALSGADARNRSSIVGTFSGFFDVSNGLGGITLGFAAAASGYRAAFAGGAIYAASGYALLRARLGRANKERIVSSSGQDRSIRRDEE